VATASRGGGTFATERDPRSGRTRTYGVVESRLRPPPARPGTEWRSALVGRLLAAWDVPVISVVAPPGYGKTTLLAQWTQEAERSGRRVAWLSLDRRDRDPAVLLSGIAAALDGTGPIGPVELRVPTRVDLSVVARAGRRVAATLSSMSEPTVLVLDHTELLDDSLARDTVAEVAAQIPTGSQLAVAARGEPPVPTALLRARGAIVEIGVDDLAMDSREAAALLEGAGVRLAEAEVAELLRRTEGWPVGLYFAALALKSGRQPDTAGFPFTGDDRLMADYLRSELLAHLSPSTVAFLTRTSVLDRMCGSVCDAVVDGKGSGRRLEALERSNLLMVPLDRQRKWYRYHHLFHDLLRSELGRLDPDLVPELHARAAAWCEANREPEMAIDHAQAAGDPQRVARLVLHLAFPTYAGGRVETCRRWFQWFEAQGLIEQYPPIAVLGAVLHALMGEPGAAELWAASAERGAYEGKLPDGSTMTSWLAQLRAFLCRDGVGRMRLDAVIARDGLAPASPWRPSALLLEGISYLLDGDSRRAEPILARTVDVAVHLGAMPAASVALAERAVIAIARDDWPSAETLADRAVEIVQGAHLEDYGPTTLVHAVVARTSLHRGDVPRARESVTRAARTLPALTYAIPFFGVQTRLELANAYLALADTAGARTLLREAWDILQVRPNVGVLPRRADELRSKLDATGDGSVGVSSLTSAELRLLPLLSTHLSFREIGERLYVSRHTVKTQAISVYRKLGVSSRSEAIERVHQVGLLHD
jgi:LuxR family transcriptional regulator, maltose regulon positive regulatory protein